MYDRIILTSDLFYFKDEDGDLSKYDLSDFGGMSTSNEESREMQHEEPTKTNQHRLQNCRTKSPINASRRNLSQIDVS